MEAKDIIFAVVMVCAAFILSLRVLSVYRKDDPVIVLSVVLLTGMIALLFLSVEERLKRVEESISEKERSIRVSMQSVEDEVRGRVSEATNKMDEILRIMGRRY
ncbi:MAG: hypothetical protein N2V77_07125 [Canidatus Methanoxibalbensis ujae]|nr:hypothetical protein [Candidatus Methanoxibalbensis ujae]MCW7078017.1 hypothetical protein [Candidatus Methanoxibalbensis ujae]